MVHLVLQAVQVVDLELKFGDSILDLFGALNDFVFDSTDCLLDHLDSSAPLVFSILFMLNIFEIIKKVKVLGLRLLSLATDELLEVSVFNQDVHDLFQILGLRHILLLIKSVTDYSNEQVEHDDAHED